ncbi:uncharacterized protein LOC112349981 [Selaginella moellendorffii]|nr:uncharacterized protein LOC112349981 [Selaginella moellendorffii]|eukprot:XP_024541109.1 uncharacterized protein LOC112349981 [Selaginella moellendorffii]
MGTAFHVLWLLLPVITRSAWGFYEDFPAADRNIYNETYAFRILARHVQSPAETSSFEYKGGRLLVEPITVYFFFIGNWTKHAKQAVRYAILSLNDESPGKLDRNNTGYPTLSKWWKVATQYTDATSRPVSSSISLGSECSLSLRELEMPKLLGTFAQAFNRSSPIQANCTKVFRAENTAVYHVLFSKHVTFLRTGKDFLPFTNCAGRASLFRVDESGPKISLAWVRVPFHKEYCNLVTRFGESYTPPNGKSGGLDSLISKVLAQTADMATNWDFKGWVASSNSQTSVAQQCPSPTGSEDSVMPVIHDREKMISWNVYGRNGTRYLVQQLWNQDQRNCALKPLRSCQGKRKLTTVTGTIMVSLIVDSTPGAKVGLQPYNSNLHCQWTVSVSNAVHIRIHLNYLALGPGDTVEISYECRHRICKRIVLKGYSPGKKLVDAKGASFHIKFTSGSQASPNRMGWMISYKAGFCKRSVDVRQARGSINDGSPKGVKYMKGSNCSWHFHALQNSKVRLYFTRLETIASSDVIRVYHRDHHKVLAEYSGKGELPRQAFKGPITLEFSSQTGDGDGWALNYVMDSPQTTTHLSYTARSAAVTALGAVCGVFVPGVIFLGAVVLCCNFSVLPVRRSKIQPSEEKPRLHTRRKFSLEELREATMDFYPANVVSDSDGNVFRGTLQDGCVVVIKKKVSELELDILLRIRSANIVDLVGFSSDAEQKCLVFDYMHLGRLSRRLFDDTLPPISWGNRLRIACQISRAVEYLHTYAEPHVVHLNISAENVLLDGSWNAKLSGFGRAQSSSVAIKPSLKLQDVYSFGSLVLELVTGKASSDRKHKREALAAIETGMGHTIMDKRLENESQIAKMGEIAAWCMSDSRRQPSMVEVSSTLSQVTAMVLRSASKKQRPPPGKSRD